jgi:hypothetical protein
MVNMLEENTPPTAIAVISAEKTHFESGKEQRMFGNMRCILYGLPLKSNICGAPDFFGSVSGFCVTQLRTHDVLGWEDTCPLMIRKSISCETSPKESQRQQGEAFFRLLVQHLCKALKTDFACVSELDASNPDRLRAFAFYGGDKFFDEVAYDLAGTPCGAALASGRASYPLGVQSAFPQDYQLVEMGVESYLGVALTDSNRQPLGILSVMSHSPNGQT